MLTTFRQGDRCDVDVLARISQEAFDPAYGEAWTPAQLINAFSLPAAAVELVFDHDEPVSFALTRRILDEAELLLVAVRPAWRGRGVARRLVRRVLENAAVDGAGAMFLEVRSGNIAASGLYNALGFRPIGRRLAYYTGAGGVRYDAITMRRDLGTQYLGTQSN